MMHGEFFLPSIRDKEEIQWCWMEFGNGFRIGYNGPRDVTRIAKKS